MTHSSSPRILCFAAATLLFASSTSAADLQCRLSAQSVPAYGRIEISCLAPFKVDNPDDPLQAGVEAVFASPSGRQWRMPGFWLQDFERREGALVKRGQPEWRVRFTPTEPGQWKAVVRARSSGQTLDSGELAFGAEPAQARGFLRRSKANPLALEFENGDPLIAIGSNVFPQTKIGQPLGADRAVETIRYLERTAAAGGTFCRLRMDSWFIPLDLPRDEATGYQGPGRYDAQSAWEVDRIVEAAERLGLTLMLCVENANATVNGPTKGDRARYNQYHKDGGGPLDDMPEFWTDPEARRLFHQKMRYCVARWGYSPAIGVWEFFNEVSLKSERAEAIAQWHDEMSKAWREMDPYGRPIATSPLGGAQDADSWRRLFDSPAIDLIQYHTYSFYDLAQGIGGVNLQVLKKADKPLLVGEFGSQVRLREQTPGGKGSDPVIDPKGLHLHNGIWAGVMTGAAGALPWFIRNYIDPLDLYPIYTGLSRFAADWKINEGPWRPLEATAKALAEPGAQKWASLDLPVKESMARPQAEVYKVGRDGSLGGPAFVNAFLFGLGAHKDLRLPPTFEVDYPVDGQFIVTVRYVVGKSGSKTPVTIELDGQEAARREYALGEGQGKKAEYIPQYDNWRVAFDDPIAIDVPAGRRRIKVDAGGTDRASVAYRLTNCVEPGLSTYRVFAMGWKDGVRLWIQNSQNTYYNHFLGQPPTEAPRAEVRVPVSSPGRYEAQWWDTVKGEPTRTEAVESQDGFLTLDFAGTLSDEACKIRRVD